VLVAKMIVPSGPAGDSRRSGLGTRRSRSVVGARLSELALFLHRHVMDRHEVPHAPELAHLRGRAQGNTNVLVEGGNGGETRTLFFAKCSMTSTAGRCVSSITKFVWESIARSILAMAD
jgi:hypothetical protein